MSTFDRSGALLEGIRISSGNNEASFPPRSLVSNFSVFSNLTERSEYAILVDSLDSTKFDFEIVDPNLIFKWVKNSANITRFDYDQFNDRFLPLPGGPPEELGSIKNNPRLTVTPPDTDKLSESPIDIYIFNEISRSITFTIQHVGTNGDFTDPNILSSGIVQISKATGNLNFSNLDIQLYEGKIVLIQNQNFFDRRSSSGIIGELPSSSNESYFLFLNPKPATGYRPRIRIDFGPYLTPIEVSNEGALGSPIPGTFTWSLNTGRVKFSDFDINQNINKNIYYDGLTQGAVQFTRIPVAISGSGGNTPVFTIPNIGNYNLDINSISDFERFIIFAEKITTNPIVSENQVLSGSDKKSLNSTRVAIFSIKVFNQDRTVEYKGPTNLEPDYLIVANPASESPQIYRTSNSQITNSETVLIDYLTYQVDRFYWITELTKGPPSKIMAKKAYIDIDTGNVYIPSRDLTANSGKTYYYCDSVLEIENGSAVQFFRSGSNGAGRPVSSDFWIKYRVENQLISDNLNPFPFITIPTVPIVDASLTYTIDGNKGFTGELHTGGDPNTEGLGYFLNLSSKQFSFSERRQTEFPLNKDSSFIKFNNVMLSRDGLIIKIGDQITVPGTDYAFDPTAGIIEFTTPVGENNPENQFGISGLITLPNRFTSIGSFTTSNIGKYLLISTGENTGLYQITTANTNEVIVTPNFISSGTAIVDIRINPEILADRIWTTLDIPYKKFSISRAPSSTGYFTELKKSEFSIQENVAQIGIKTAANPGEVFSITYVALITDDNGATYTEENRTERALFKIRQETAVIAVGSNVVTFNSNGKTVNTTRPIDCYVNGIVLDQNQFNFTSPGTLTLDRRIEEGQTVILNYWVEEANGGETSFNLQVDQISLDRPEINEDELTATFNGNQTNYITRGSIILIEQVEVLVINSVSYNLLDDVTVITFQTAPTISTNSFDILIAQPITFIEEANNVDIIPEGSNILSIQGNVVSNYTIGSIVKVNNTPYLVIGTNYDSDFNKTKVVIAGSFHQNYIIPIVEKSERSIIFPTLGFATSKSAHLDYPVTLVKMGTSRAILTREIDYSISDGGLIRLTNNLSFGDILYVMYVGRENLPAGTILDLNYAFYIVPADWNRLLRQKLYCTYNLYAPDTFFYRVETIDSFLPEVRDYARTSSSSGSSGPNTTDAYSSSTKDAGTASPWYNEQHLNNLDLVMIKLLKYYNDLINIYEDILSNLDGRMVGGENGRFRFDGNSNYRNNYEEIRNDIDDLLVLYTRRTLTGFWSWTRDPVYIYMALPSLVSRLFSTIFHAGVFIDGNQTGVDQFGEVIGAYGIENLKSVKTSKNAKSNHFFSSGSPGVSVNIEIAPQNGDPANLLPAFADNNSVQIYTQDGVLLGTEDITAISGNTVTLSNAPIIDKGSILLDSPIGIYELGIDFSVDLETGQLLNNNREVDSEETSSLIGNQIIVSPIAINDPGLDPKRIPILDGQEFNDDGRVPEPRLKRTSEINLLNDEITVSSNYLSIGSVAVDLITITGSNIGTLFKIGDIIRWLNGPNAGLQRKIINILNANSFVINTTLSFADATGSTFQVGSVMATVVGNQLIGDNIGNNFVIGDQIEFMNGSNIHVKLQISSIISFNTVMVNIMNGNLINDSNPRELGFQIAWAVANSRTPILKNTVSVVSDELFLLSYNIETSIPSTSLSKINKINSELTCADLIINSYGKGIAFGTALVNSATLTDLNANFTLDGVNDDSLVYIMLGNNQGLYKVSSVTSTSITVVSNDPWSEFPVAGWTNYRIISPETFLDSTQFGIMSKFLRETLDFFGKTVSWYSAISVDSSSIISRTNDILNRQSNISEFIGDIENILVSGLYDARYLWIQQRTNRRMGTLAQKLVMKEQIQERMQQMKSDQKRITLIGQLR